MSTKKPTLHRLALLPLLSLCFHCQSVLADDFEPLDDPAQIDESAETFQRTSNLLCWELYRFHAEQPDYAPVYRDAKEAWERTTALRDALRSGDIDPARLNDQIVRIHELYIRVEQGTAGWQAGVRPPLTPAPAREVVVDDGVGINIPFVGGFRVGSAPRVVAVEPELPGLPRRRFHPNAHGSRRALERRITLARIALNDLMEDAGVGPADLPEKNSPTAPPVPPKTTGPELAPPVKIGPRASRTALPKPQK